MDQDDTIGNEIPEGQEESIEDAFRPRKSEEKVPTLDELFKAQEPEPEPAPAPEPQAEPVANGDDSGEASGEDMPAQELDPSLVEKDDGIKRRWYAIHAYSGQEGNVKKHLEVNASLAGLSDLFAGILVPMEEVAEIKSGEKRISKRKFFPGYVLVRLPVHPEEYPELWHLIKETPGVSGFIGSRTAPVPLDDAEVKAILDEARGDAERPKPKVRFEHGERVKIIDGPFSNFLGSVDDINIERGTMRVMVEIFERLTSVEVEFWQVEKV
jgi:transcription termination/antitermination protein NusG